MASRFFVLLRYAVGSAIATRDRTPGSDKTSRLLRHAAKSRRRGVPTLGNSPELPGTDLPPARYSACATRDRAARAVQTIVFIVSPNARGVDRFGDEASTLWLDCLDRLAFAPVQDVLVPDGAHSPNQTVGIIMLPRAPGAQYSSDMAPRRARPYSPYAVDAARLLGAQIRLARRERRWSQQELATRVGITPRTVYKIEHGDLSVGLGAAFETAALLGVPLFHAERSRLTADLDRVDARTALLPRPVLSRREGEAKDDF